MHIPGNIGLFRGIPEAELVGILSCFGVRDRAFKARQVILREGDPMESVGIVLWGEVQVSRTLDADLPEAGRTEAGERVILANFGQGEVFAESLACAETRKSPVTVTATRDSAVLFLPFNKLVHSCARTCSGHSRLIANMLALLAEKNLALGDKIEILAKRSIRSKVMAYLSRECRLARSRSFSIPFSRNALADYLCVDRSALSRELGKMRDEGILGFEDKRFELKRFS